MARNVIYVFNIIALMCLLTGCSKKNQVKIGIQGDEANASEKENPEIGNTTVPQNTNTGVVWERNPITVYTPKRGGVWYPRMYMLKNGKLLCGFDTNEAGGRTVIKVVTSEDGGLTWSKSPVQSTDLPEYDCANASFIELDNGDIWLAYRANVQQGDEYYSSIRVNISKDGGVTWNPLSIVAEEKGAGGVYEPQFDFIENTIAVFYANDSLNVVKRGSQQNIEFKLWETDHWSEKRIASDGTNTDSRDGMPVWCQLLDGSYALVIESTSLSPQAEFIIQIKKSPDGIDWSDTLQTIYIPNGRGKKAGAPYIVRCDDGRVAVSFQTDEDASLTGDAYSQMKVMISTTAAADEFLQASVPFHTPNGYCSNWNSLLSYGDYLLAVTSTNYPKSCIMLERGNLQ